MASRSVHVPVRDGIGRRIGHLHHSGGHGVGGSWQSRKVSTPAARANAPQEKIYFGIRIIMIWVS